MPMNDSLQDGKKSMLQAMKFFTLDSLTEAEMTPPEFIVDGMIPCGMTFLSGAPKTRKSFMALQMAASVANGETFLGHNTLQCSVCYFDLEGSKSRISSRVGRMGLKLPSNVFVTNETERKLSNGLVEQIAELHHQRPDIRLIIVDTYSRARGVVKTGGSNAYDTDVQFLEPVQRMAMSENIAVLFVHHDKKGAGYVTDSFERLSGTMGISGSADSVLNLVSDGKRFDGKATLEFNPRDAKGGEMKLYFDEIFCQWRVDDTPTYDLRSNPVLNWCIENAPDRGKEGVTVPYDLVYRGAYNAAVSNPGDKIRAIVEEHKIELYSDYGIGVQMGVKSNGSRGIRLFNTL